MKRSTDRILTTHAGSLPRPRRPDRDVQRRTRPTARLEPRLQAPPSPRSCAQQADAGIDIVNDGEFGKASRGPGRLRRLVVLHLRAPCRASRCSEGGVGRAEHAAAGQQGPRDVQQFYDTEDGDIGRHRRSGLAAGKRGCAAGLHRSGQLHRPRADPARHRQPQGSARRRARRRGVHARRSRPRRCRSCATSTTRARKTTPGPWPRRCARSTGRSSTRGFVAADRRPGAGRPLRLVVLATDDIAGTASGPSSRSRR